MKPLFSALQSRFLTTGSSGKSLGILFNSWLLSIIHIHTIHPFKVYSSVVISVQNVLCYIYIYTHTHTHTYRDVWQSPPSNSRTFSSLQKGTPYLLNSPCPFPPLLWQAWTHSVSLWIWLCWMFPIRVITESPNRSVCLDLPVMSALCKENHTLCGLWCLASLSWASCSQRICVVVSVSASLLSWLRNVPLYKQTTFCLSVHALINIWAVSTLFGYCE